MAKLYNPNQQWGMTVLLVTNSWLDSSLLRTDWVQERVERKGCQGREEEEGERWKGVDAIGIVVLNPSNGPKCNLCLEGLCHRADPVETAKK